MWGRFFGGERAYFMRAFPGYFPNLIQAEEVLTESVILYIYIYIYIYIYMSIHTPY